MSFDSVEIDDIVFRPYMNYDPNDGGKMIAHIEANMIREKGYYVRVIKRQNRWWLVRALKQ